MEKKQPIALIHSDGSLEIVGPTTVGALLRAAQVIEQSVQNLSVSPNVPPPPPQEEDLSE